MSKSQKTQTRSSQASKDKHGRAKPVAAPSARKPETTSHGFQLWWAVIAALVLLVAVWIYWFLGRQEQATGTLPAEISVDQAYDMYKAESAFFLDVREQEEWDQYRIPNTTLISLGSLENHANELPKDQPIVVVCNSGNRSQQGRELLLRLGFTDVTSMAGGVKQWKASSYPTISGP
jgi:rhodanese-related sulfurtransferase